MGEPDLPDLEEWGVQLNSQETGRNPKHTSNMFDAPAPTNDPSQPPNIDQEAIQALGNMDLNDPTTPTKPQPETVPPQDQTLLETITRRIAFDTIGSTTRATSTKASPLVKNAAIEKTQAEIRHLDYLLNSELTSMRNLMNPTHHNHNTHLADKDILAAAGAEGAYKPNALRFDRIIADIARITMGRRPSFLKITHEADASYLRSHILPPPQQDAGANNAPTTHDRIDLLEIRQAEHSKQRPNSRLSRSNWPAFSIQH